MTTIQAIFTVSESGSVTSETFVNASTYEHKSSANTYGSPYLGEYITSEAWRKALADYGRECIGNLYSVGGLRYTELVYVDDACSMYVWQFIFDSPTAAIVEPAPVADWERELLAEPPACVCDWLIDGEQVLPCRVHSD